jgi:serine/threonine protein kinase
VSQQIGNYKVIQKLGEGGMGVVYLAEHAVIGRQAAIKLLLPAMSANAEAVTRFFNEARATARIKHPGIVEILDCGTLANGQAYIVMEFLQGETLGSYSTRYGKLADDPNLARALIRQVATALGAAHARGIIHRDLKPDNVFLASEGGAIDAATVKILDFGIAKLVNPGELPAVTTTRELLGTPVYISPEQCKGAKDLDHRTDVYALGCIAFELLTGAPVFKARSLAELIASHMFKEPPALRELEPTVPAALAELVRRMLAKAPEDRPRTMDEIVAAIDGAGVAPALRGGAVLLSAARPLSLALPVPDPSPSGGVLTLLAGGTRVGPVEPAEPATGSTFSGLVSEARPEVRAPSTHKKAWALGAGAAALAGLALILIARASGGRGTAAAVSTPGSNVVAAPPAAPRTVDIDVEDRPPGLSVTVDGNAAQVPISLPLGAEPHTLVFRADGYEPMTKTLDGTKSRTLVLGMRRTPEPAPAVPPASRGAGAATKPTAKRGAKSRDAKGGKRGHATDLFLDI